MSHQSTTFQADAVIYFIYEGMIMTHKFLVINAETDDETIKSWKRAIQSQTYLLSVASTLLPALNQQETALLTGQLKMIETIMADLEPKLHDPLLENRPISRLRPCFTLLSGRRNRF